ncbi:hypothetical protein E2C01_072339 [Portunus trituberculatus]|uniref:Uncharacterized protein n=1 Tax=Portunus trituberculatus TaxID=210409 RepID=A0A5B7HZL6_PORTR|nr:hypothetical protein [Portunus trituberculatus]
MQPAGPRQSARPSARQAARPTASRRTRLVRVTDVHRQKAYTVKRILIQDRRRAVTGEFARRGTRSGAINKEYIKFAVSNFPLKGAKEADINGTSVIGSGEDGGTERVCAAPLCSLSLLQSRSFTIALKFNADA